MLNKRMHPPYTNSLAFISRSPCILHALNKGRLHNTELDIWGGGSMNVQSLSPATFAQAWQIELAAPQKEGLLISGPRSFQLRCFVAQ